MGMKKQSIKDAYFADKLALLSYIQSNTGVQNLYFASEKKDVGWCH